MSSLATTIKDHQIAAFTQFKFDLNSNGIEISQIIFTQNNDKQTVEVNNDLATIISKIYDLASRSISGTFVYTTDDFPNIRLGQDFFIETDFEEIDGLSENPITLLGGYDYLDDYQTNNNQYNRFQDTLIDVCDRYTDTTSELFGEVISNLF